MCAAIRDEFTDLYFTCFNFCILKVYKRVRTVKKMQVMIKNMCV